MPGRTLASPARLTRLWGLRFGDTVRVDDGRIRTLQEALMALGLLDPAVRANVGYGRTFGALTLEALQRLQAWLGLPPSREVDAYVGAVLDDVSRQLARGRAPRAGLFSDCFAAPVGAGGQGATPGAPPVALPGWLPSAPGRVTSVAEANAHFVNQEGPTAWFAPTDGRAVPFGYNDCGPASAVMLVSALGLLARPSAADAPATLDAMRDAMLGFDSTRSHVLNASQLRRGLAAYGAELVPLSTRGGLRQLDGALAVGQPLLLLGVPGRAWAARLNDDGNYLDMGSLGTASFQHWVTVLGRTGAGGYLVGDPLSREGVVEVSAAELQAFLGSSGAAWAAGACSS